MSGKILVSGICQAAGIGSALQCLMPRAQISIFPLVKFNEPETVDKLKSAVSSSDIWVYTPQFVSVKQFDLFVACRKKTLVKIPHIDFNAFHPDIVYIRNSGSATNDALYRSLIASRAWHLGISKSETVKLFSARVMERLGYLAVWESNVVALRHEFNQGEIEFPEFFLAAKRLGAFMYTCNHPRQELLTILAKLIARKLSGSRESMPQSISVPDTLNRDIWPVYPPIAGNYGLNGSLYWKFGDKYFDLEQFIDREYEILEKFYSRANVAKWTFFRPGSKLSCSASYCDEILLSEMEAAR